MKMGRRTSRGKAELVVRRDFRDLSWLSEKEDIFVHYHHQHIQFIGYRACNSDPNP